MKKSKKDPWKGYRWFCFDCASVIKGNPRHPDTGCLSTHFAMQLLKQPKA